MSKIQIENKQLPVAVTVKYISTENKKVSQTIKKKSLATSIKEVKPNTEISVSAFAKTETINYESGQRTLQVLQKGDQIFILNWD